MKITINYGYGTTSLFTGKNVTHRFWWVNISSKDSSFVSFPLLYKPTERQIRRLKKLWRKYRSMNDVQRDNFFLNDKAFNFVSVNEWTGKLEVKPL